VKQLPGVWSLYLLAKQWGNAPSAHLGLEEGSYEAYCLDEAVMIFGARVSSALEEVDGKNKAQIEQKQSRLLERLLYPGKPISAKHFRSPFA
jgi:hypothetical protein